MSQRGPRSSVSVLALLLAVFSAALTAPAFAEDPEPEPDPVPEQGTSCLLKVTQDSDGIKAGLPALQVRLAQTSEDSASPVYEGTLLSLPLKVTLWRGLPAAEVDSAVNAGIDDADELAEASMDGVEEQEGEVPDDGTEGGGTFDTVDDVVGQLETLAYRVQLGPLVEFGLNTGNSVLGCASALVTSLTGVVLSSPLVGTISLPKAELSDTEISPALSTGAAPNIIAAPYFPADDGAMRYMTPAAWSSSTRVIRYRAFIADQYASTGYLCGTFKGDNRGWTKYYAVGARTRVSVFWDWPRRIIGYTTNIGTTHRIAAYNKSAASAKASDAGIRVSDPRMNSAETYGRVKVDHSVGNPLCRPAGPIQYHLVWESWKNGAARIRGELVRVPNHEAYVYKLGEDNGDTILRKARNGGWYCLSVPCARETIDEEGG